MRKRRYTPKPSDLGRLQRYEHEKAAWLADNPKATNKQYQDAMNAIAKRCSL